MLTVVLYGLAKITFFFFFFHFYNSEFSLSMHCLANMRSTQCWLQELKSHLAHLFTPPEPFKGDEGPAIWLTPGCLPAAPFEGLDEASSSNGESTASYFPCLL